MRCDIVICNYPERVERFRIPDRDVPPSYYSGGGQPASWLDAARITVNTLAWTFFDPKQTTLDKFEGTDLRSGDMGVLPAILVYMMDETPQEEVEALVNALAEKLPRWKPPTPGEPEAQPSGQGD